MQTVPDLSNPRFSLFLDFLLGSKVASPPGILRPVYPDDSQLLAVPVKLQPEFQIGQCWFNCIEHWLIYGGQVVYGWLFWEVNQVYYVAQHHAVWRSPQGGLTDLTPNAIGATEVYFMPDDRAPFDVENLKAAMNLEWTSNELYAWVAGNNRSSEFKIMEMVATDPITIDRIAKIRAKLNLA